MDYIVTFVVHCKAISEAEAYTVAALAVEGFPDAGVRIECAVTPATIDTLSMAANSQV